MVCRTDDVQKAGPSKKIKATDDEELWFKCTICYEMCQTNGEHVIVSLDCGHLFGDRCVRK